MPTLIYVADDDTHIRQLICTFLLREGFEAIGFANGAMLLDAFAERPADLVILDIMMPGPDGLDVLTTLRHTSHVPVMIVSAKDSEIDRVTGISLGGDDYMVKPFSPLEMTVRVKALLRRARLNTAQDGAGASVLYGDVTVDSTKREVRVGDMPFPATPTEFDFLHYMIAQKDRAISKNELLRELWHIDFETDTRVTDDLVKRLRRKLAAADSRVRIETVWGYGYRLSEADLP